MQKATNTFPETLYLSEPLIKGSNAKSHQ